MTARCREGLKKTVKKSKEGDYAEEKGERLEVFCPSNRVQRKGLKGKGKEKEEKKERVTSFHIFKIKLLITTRTTAFSDF
jgi:hypothetical protein